MERSRVVVLDDGSLLASSLISLLREQPTIECVAVRENAGDQAKAIRLLAPDVVVVTAVRTSDDVPDAVAELLGADSRPCVVALSLDQPRIEVYQSRRIEPTSVTDFLAAVVGHSRERTVCAAGDAAARPNGEQQPGGRQVEECDGTSR